MTRTLFRTTLAAVLIGLPLSAGAATLSLSAGGLTATLPGGSGNDGFDLAAETGLSQGDTITYFDRNNDGGVTLDTGSTLRYTYLGSEAGNTNQAIKISTGAAFFDTSTSSVGDTFTTAGGPGFLDFLFKDTTDNQQIANGNTLASPDDNLKLGFSGISADGNSVIALFGDGMGDTDFDDIAVRISAVPVPAGGMLLLTALGGLGLARRRRRAA